MEQFEIRTHKRLLDIISPTAKTVDELKKLNLPAGSISASRSNCLTDYGVTTMKGLIGRKLGMTQVYDAKGHLTTVTAIEAGPCTVLALRTPEKKRLLRHSTRVWGPQGQERVESGAGHAAGAASRTPRCRGSRDPPGGAAGTRRWGDTHQWRLHAQGIR